MTTDGPSGSRSQENTNEGEESYSDHSDSDSSDSEAGTGRTEEEDFERQGKKSLWSNRTYIHFSLICVKVILCLLGPSPL